MYAGRPPLLVPPRRVRAFLALLGGLLLLLAAAGPAGAAAGPWAENDNTRLRLIAESEAVGTAERLAVGLQFELAPGWKTYWRSPGDAGYPVTIDWSASENLAEARLDWPVPHRFTLFGLDTFGYEEEVVFPLTLVPERPGEPLRLVGEVDYLLCEQVCIPYVERVELALPAGPATPAPEAFLLDLYRAQLPAQGPTAGEESGLALERVGLAGSGEGLRLEARARSLFPFAEPPDLLVEGPQGFHFGRPQVRLSEEGRRADIVLPVTVAAAADPAALNGATARLTLVDGRRGLEAEESLIRLAGAGPAVRAEQGLALILGFALLGGLLLNLMPCVLPVLSLKLLSAVKHGGGAPGPVRLSFLATAAGILASFLLLAGGAVALQAGGATLGWGIQFQQPLFLAAMALVVTLFAANLFGFFEILLPGGLADTAGKASAGRGLAGDFGTGAFATLLATPCSAPFLGTAVGFALSRGPAEILMIFTALGLGLALPYLAVAAWPRLATALPRPGRWMLWLRRLLALALVATALWLLSVLAVQIGARGALALGGLLAALLGVFALRRFARPPRLLVPGAATALALAVLTVAALPGPAGSGAPAAAIEEHWRPFERAGIADAVAEGRTVFVDVTADWCITCQVNKTRVLQDAAVAERLGEESLLALRADWTRPDAAIAAYLADHGRYGIPFNAVYGPGAPEGIVLPELLGVETVLQALERAAGE